ncbi:MAG TPA: AMP-dependent synthetase/ligase [Solirubrobacteraceae bacterium]|nr:AMP-dependent synthetase/ligase [Solirubrobacteraceae bacterium]
MTAPSSLKTSTLPALFAASVAARAGEPALRSSDGATVWTWGEYARRVRAAAGGYAGLGVGRGDTVALWLTNRPQFHVADVAAVQLGAAPFSIYATFTLEQAEHVIGDAGCRVLVTEPAFLERALAVRARGRTALEQIVLVEGAHHQALGWEQLLAAAPADFDAEAAAASVRPDDLATLIYTSGTTGPPKGVELTHANLLAQIEVLREVLQLPDGLRAISWLPMAHIAERLCTHYMPMALGWSVTSLADPRAIAAALPHVRPEFFFSPPRIWEKLRATLGEPPAGGLEALGLDAVEVAVVAAAPCAPEVIEYWHRLGLPLFELYGLSETTGVATGNRPGANRVGTVGRPTAGVEVELSEQGEVLIRGPIVMRGYRNQPDATAAAIDADGWLHTGDIGVLEAGGYLRIVDRIKELIINAAGKNMSPANIETTIKAAGGGLIGNVCCIGDARAYNTALITLDADAAAAHGLSAGDSRAEQAVALAVERANLRLGRVEQIKRFTVLGNDWVPGGEELTPTSKLKRKSIAAIYAAEIDAMY